MLHPSQIRAAMRLAIPWLVVILAGLTLMIGGTAILAMVARSLP